MAIAYAVMQRRCTDTTGSVLQELLRSRSKIQSSHDIVRAFSSAHSSSILSCSSAASLMECTRDTMCSSSSPCSV